MNTSKFIQTVAEVAVSDWQKRKIMLPSVVIAQAILESGWGESELAVNANALFGIKKHDWTGAVYVKVATEQRKDGSYYQVEGTEWRAYNSWTESIVDHNDYIATRKTEKGALRYEPIIGNTDHKEVCKLLKECGYATSLTYPDKLLNIINTYKLTKYDNGAGHMLRIAIDAGHGLNTLGKRCLKKLDSKQTREWTLNDRIADKLERLLVSYNCEVLRTDDTTGAKDVSLANRVKAANDWGADVFISIHHNAGINGGSGGGTEVFWSSSKAEREAQAQALYEEVVSLTRLIGNRADRVKEKGFYVIKNTSMPAFLIENGFMDSSTDVPVILSESHADKTAQGLLNFLTGEFGLTKKESTLYRVQCGAFSVKANAEALKEKLEADGYEAVIVSVQT